MSNFYVRRTGGASVEAIEQSGAMMAAVMVGGDKTGGTVPLRGWRDG